MAERTPRKWPYAAAKPARMKRVVRTRPDEAPKGVLHRDRAPEPLITPLQARLALLALIIMGAVAGGWWAYRSPWLTVRSVSVAGVETVSAADVRQAAALDGESTFGLDLGAARTRVEAMPGVKSATVSRRGWNAVSIIVEERQPWGSWRIGPYDVPIDTEGVVLGRVPPPGSPVIVEDQPHRAINIGDRLDPGAVDLAARLIRDADSALGRGVKALIYQQDRGLTAVLAPRGDGANDVWATFGDARDYDYKLAALYVLIEQAKQEDVPLVTADLRFGDRLSFR